MEEKSKKSRTGGGGRDSAEKRMLRCSHPKQLSSYKGIFFEEKKKNLRSVAVSDLAWVILDWPLQDQVENTGESEKSNYLCRGTDHVL